MSIIGGVVGGLGSLFGGLAAAKGQSDKNDDMRNAMADDRKAKLLDALFAQAKIEGPEAAMATLRAKGGGELLEEIFGKAATPGQIGAAEQGQIEALRKEKAALQGSGSGSGSASKPSRSSQGIVRVIDNGSGTSPAEARSKQIDDEIAKLLSAGAPATKGRMGEDEFKAMFAGKNLTQQYEDLATTGRDDGTKLLGQYDGDFAKAMETVRGLETDARAYGQRRIDQVGVDAQRQLTGLNRGSMAAAQFGGVGSGSLLNQQARGNQLAVGEQAQRERNVLEDQRLGQMLGLGQQRVGMMQQNAGSRAALQGANIDRQTALARMPVDFRANMTQSPVLNPGSSINTAPYAQMGSPSSQLGTALGGFASQLGGQMNGRAMLEELLKEK